MTTPKQMGALSNNPSNHQEREMEMFTWSGVVRRAIEANVAIEEITVCGCIMGYKMGGHIVRPDTLGWYDAAKVDEVIEKAKMGV